MNTQELKQSYEVVDYNARVDVLDIEGREACYTRRERVRFLKRTSIIRDYGWGNGIAFAEHEISPDKLTERKLIRSRLRSTVKLPVRGQPGEELTFTVDRLVKNGFVSPGEWWLEAELYHQTQHLSLEVRLPGSRRVLEARLARGHIQKQKKLTVRLTPDGQQTISYRSTDVDAGERFKLSWIW